MKISKLALILLSILISSGCGAFVDEYIGGEEQSCSTDGECKGSLYCCGDYVCRSSCKGIYCYNSSECEEALTCCGDGVCRSSCKGIYCYNNSECGKALTCCGDSVCRSSCPVVWKDSSTGLTWQNPPVDKVRTWSNAKYYCSSLSLDGHDDWRLPTISELRSLIRGCPATATGGACGVTDSCLEYSCHVNTSCGHCYDESCWGPCPEDEGPSNGYYNSEELLQYYWTYWSSSSVSDSLEYAWLVEFDDGLVNHGDKDNNFHVSCVRGSSGESP